MIELLLQARRADEAGRLDEAERRYRQVLAADPRNVIALVALARLARRRGDRAAASELAISALAVDPGNVAARAERDALGAGGTSGSEVPPPGGAPLEEPGAEWPWPDLDQQLERYRPRSSPISRLLGRGRRGQRGPMGPGGGPGARDDPERGR